MAIEIATRQAFKGPEYVPEQSGECSQRILRQIGKRPMRRRSHWRQPSKLSATLFV